MHVALAGPSAELGGTAWTRTRASRGSGLAPVAPATGPGPAQVPEVRFRPENRARSGLVPTPGSVFAG